MKLRQSTVVGVAAAMVMGATALPASANVVTCNNSSLTNGTISGDLRVPAGSFCVLDGVTVQGNVLVLREADLLADGTTVGGNVEVRAEGYAEFADSSIAGDVTGQASFGQVLFDTEIGGDIATRRNQFVFLLGGDLAGSMDIRAAVDARTETFVESLRVGGNLETNNNDFTDVFDSTIEGDLTIARAEQGSIFCTSEVDGNALFNLNRGTLQIGGDDCGPVYFGSDLQISRHTGAPTLEDTIVRGDLRCNGNTTAPTGTNVRVRGEAIGQCADLGSSAFGMMAMSSDASVDVAEDRKAAALEAFEARRAQTERASVGALSMEGEPVVVPESPIEGAQESLDEVRESRLDEARAQVSNRR
ncbi:hypothetical protein [Egicoccus halophilus]|uniref:Polymer-forming protein n=1 Tax=Egicoccus halophilus TaxID=1670830 RepID=A0A8J3AB20_9ACTN|nr:hypothetical protein [Egicoccus halophilus]GGI03707.1 hypothetical protein GCM10011354_05380 [Egicoccus halophilus]